MDVGQLIKDGMVRTMYFSKGEQSGITGTGAQDWNRPGMPPHVFFSYYTGELTAKGTYAYKDIRFFKEHIMYAALRGTYLDNVKAGDLISYDRYYPVNKEKGYEEGVAVKHFFGFTLYVRPYIHSDNPLEEDKKQPFFETAKSNALSGTGDVTYEIGTTGLPTKESITAPVATPKRTRVPRTATDPKKNA